MIYLYNVSESVNKKYYFKLGRENGISIREVRAETKVTISSWDVRAKTKITVLKNQNSSWDARAETKLTIST